MQQCLKCGKKTEKQAVFCGDCLQVAKAYPVKPGSVVHLPSRQTLQNTAAVSDFQEPTRAEQTAHLRKLVRWLTVVIAFLSVLLIITAALLVHALDRQSLPAIGRNYTTSTTAQNP